MCLPHDQPRLEVQPVLGVPWVQEVHAHQMGHQVPAYQALPRR